MFTPAPISSRRKGRFGFTLIELVVTTVVIAVLATIAVVAFGQFTSRGRNAALNASAVEMRDALMAASVQRDDTTGDVAASALPEETDGATAWREHFGVSYDGEAVYYPTIGSVGAVNVSSPDSRQDLCMFLSGDARTVPQIEDGACEDFVPPAATGLSARWNVDDSATVTWLFDGPNDTTFTVQRKEAGGSWVEVGAPTAGAATFTDPSTDRSQGYEFRVLSHNLYGAAPSAPVALPSADSFTVQDLAVVWSPEQTAALSWMFYGPTGTVFTVQRKDAGTWVDVTDLGDEVRTFTDTAAATGSAHQFRVVSTGEYGTTASDPVTLPKFDDVISHNVAVKWVGDDANIAWSYDGPSATFTIERKTGAGAWTSIGNAGAAARTFTDTTVDTDVVYDYRVVTATAFGAHPSASFTLPKLSDVIAHNVAASWKSNGDATVTWTYSGPTASGFTIQAKTGAGAWTTVGTAGAAARTFTDTAADDVNAYLYRVITDTAYGQNPSDNAELPKAADLTATNVAGVWGENGASTTVTWVYDGPAADFTIQRKTEGGTWTDAGIVSGATRTFTDNASGVGAVTYRVVTATVYGTFTSEAAALPKFDDVIAHNVATTWVPSGATVTWTYDGPNALFGVERRAPGGTWASVGTAGTTARTFTDETASPVNPYEYRIVATTAFGTHASTGATLPKAADVTAKTVAATWQNFADHAEITWVYDGPVEAAFTIERRTAGTGTWSTAGTANAAARTFTDQNVDAGVSYDYRVVATSTYGTHVSGTFTLPNVDTVIAHDVAAAWTASKDAAITWTYDGPAASLFTVQRKTTGTWATVGTVASAVRTFTDQGADADTPYLYRIVTDTAFGSNVSSETALPEYATVIAHDVAATWASSGAFVTWTYTGPGNTTFTVERATDGGSWAEVGSAPAGAVSFTDTSTNNTAGYSYRIVAASKFGTHPSDSAALPSRDSVTAHDVAASWTAEASQATVGWTYGGATATFAVQRQTNGAGAWTTVTSNLSASARTFVDTSVDAGNSYSYRVVATTVYGANTSAVGALPKVADVIAKTVKPVWAASGSATITWTYDGPAASQFTVQRRIGTGPWTTAGTANAAARTFTETGLGTTTAYIYRVVATTAFGSNGSATVSLPAFDDVIVHGTAATWVNESTDAAVTWTYGGPAATFTVERQTNGVGAWLEVATGLGNTIRTFTDEDASAGNSYTYRVVATTVFGAHAGAAATLPKVADVIAKSVTPVWTGSGASKVTWTYDGSAATGFTIQRRIGTGSWTAAGTVAGTVRTFTETGLGTSTGYTYRVVATTAFGSNGSAAVNLPAFNDVIARDVAASWGTSQGASATITWVYDGPAATFAVERQTNGTGSWTTVATGLTSSARTHVDTGVTGNDSYTYRVTATTAYGSHTVAGPALPKTADVSASGVKAAWIDETGSATVTWTYTGPAATFTIERQTNAAGAWTILTSGISGTTRTFADNGATPGNSYGYRVVAVTAFGSVNSAPATLPKVADVTAADVSAAWTAESSQATVTWTYTGPAATFTLQRRTGTGAWTNATTGLGNTIRTFTDTTVNPATAYTYRVVATTVYGVNGSAAVTLPKVADVIPTGVAGVWTTESATTITWTYTGPAASGFTVQRRIGTGAWTAAGTVTGTARTFTDTGLASTTAYIYRVVATTAFGSNGSATITMPTFNDVVAHDVAASWGTSQGAAATVTWTYGGPAAVFTVQRQVNGTSAWTDVTTGLGNAARTFTDNGTTGTNAYSYRVLATTVYGTHPSAAASLPKTTDVAAGSVAPSWLSENGQAAITWIYTGPAATFRIERDVNGNGNWASVGTAPAEATQFTDTTAQAVNSYNYRVVAITAYGQVNSVPANLPKVSDVTTSATAAVWTSAGSATVTWTYNGPAATGFTVQRRTSGGAWTTAGTVAAAIRTFTNTGLGNTTGYEYRVVATTAFGSNGGQIVALPAYNDVVASGVTATWGASQGAAATVTWTYNGPAATFTIQRQASGGAWADAGTTGGNALSFTDQNVTGGTNLYRVVAATEFGTHASGAFTLPAFSEVTAKNVTGAWAADGTKITVTWTYQGPAATGFTVQRQTDGAGAWVDVATNLDGTTRTWVDTAVPVSASYSYRIVTTTVYGQATSPSTTVPPYRVVLPDDVSAVWIADGSRVHLTWIYDGPAVTSFKIEREANGTWQQLVNLANSEARSWTDTSVSTATSYRYRVSTISAIGTYASDIFNLPAYTTLTPVQVGATWAGQNATVSWTHGGANITGFQVQKQVNGTWTTVGTMAAAVRTFTDTAAAGAAGTYRVVATGSFGNATSTQVVLPSVASLTPQNVTADWAQSGAAIAWDYIGPTTGVTFTVQRQLDGDTSWIDAATGLASTARTFVDQGVDGSTGVSYRVVAASPVGTFESATVALDALVDIQPNTLVAGAYHTCGIDRSGDLWCTGSNNYGQLGVGHTINRNVFTKTSGGHKFVTLAAGMYHTCGIDTAGDLWCAGYNVFGQLGDGTTTDRNVFTTATGGHKFVTVIAGYHHTCGIDTAGDTWCTGLNNHGQLGDGTTTDRNVFTKATGNHKFVTLASGTYHTCGIDTAGDLWCTGRNTEGQLGVGDATTTQRHVFTKIFGGHKFVVATAGQLHTCALDMTGDLWCTGRNNEGQLGDATTTNRNVFTKTSGNHKFVAVTAGGNHTCGIATAGYMWCTGYNKYRQLGDGTTTSRNVFTTAAGGVKFVTVTAGEYHTCGIDTVGDMWCTGYNTHGQLGVGDTTDRYVITKLVSAPRFG